MTDYRADQPEPEVAGLSDEEVLDLADDCDLDRFEGERSYPDGTVVKEGCWEAWDHQLIAFARAIQQRCATPQPRTEAVRPSEEKLRCLWQFNFCKTNYDRFSAIAQAVIDLSATPQPAPVPAPMSADTLAAIIREVDGTHRRLGAAALAEAILAHPAAINAQSSPVPMTERLPELRGMFERILCVARSSGGLTVGNIQLAGRLIDAVVSWSGDALPVPGAEVG